MFKPEKIGFQIDLSIICVKTSLEAQPFRAMVRAYNNVFLSFSVL